MANQYVVPSPDVQSYLKVVNIPALRIETATSINLTYANTITDIFAIGTKDPISIEDLNAQYSGSISIQSGEAQLILDAINGGLPATTPPYATLAQVPSFTYSRTMSLLNAAVPKTVTESLLNCKIESISSDVNRNDPETLTTISFRGVGVQRTVSPISI